MASTGSSSSAPAAAEVVPARADVVVAIMGANDAATIGPVVRAVREGLTRDFPPGGARLLLADGGSTDATCAVARDAAGGDLIEVAYTPPPPRADLPYHGQPARAAALRAALAEAQTLGARACAVVDAGLESVGPERVAQLVGPVLGEGFDYVSPCYARRARDGALTRGIVYPTIRALYGARLQQPAAAEFGCSAGLVEHLLAQDFWETEQAPAGIDLFLSVAAICGGFRICEAALGERRTAARERQADLSTTLAQVVGALFADLEGRVDVWQRSRGSVALPRRGEVPELPPDDRPPAIDDLLETFRLGYRELREIWTWVLPPRTIIELRRLTSLAADRFHFPEALWATIVYDFALGYAMRVMPRDHLLRSLTPLYNGWVASFLRATAGATSAAVDQVAEQTCAGFEAEKRYLIARWRWPERLR
jgi:hypothetical protein